MGFDITIRFNIHFEYTNKFFTKPKQTIPSTNMAAAYLNAVRSRSTPFCAHVSDTQCMGRT